MPALLGTGTTIVFATSGFTAEVTEYAFSRISRKAVDTTHFRTTQAGAGQFGGRTFMPVKLVDPGYLTLSIAFNPQIRPPIHGASETITLTMWYLGLPVVRSWTGFVTAWQFSIPLEDKMTASVELKLSGVGGGPPVQPIPETLRWSENWEVSIAPPTTLLWSEDWEELTVPDSPTTMLWSEDWEA